MDIGRMSMNMSMGSLKAAVNLSLMKMQMDTKEEMAVGMRQMLETAAVDLTKGKVIDKTI